MDNTIQKEIAEQAKLLERYNDHQVAQIEKVAKIINDTNTSGGRIFMFGSGSSLNACYYARELFSRDNDLVLEVFPAGEAKNHANDIKREDLIILVSQSGESRDILKIKDKIENIKNIVITNNIDSTLAKGADTILDLKAGEEKAVPATKTYFASLLVFIMLSEVLKGEVQVTKTGNIVPEGLKIPKIESLSDKKIYVLGSGVAWPQAMEAELKLKEIAKLEAEGYEISEFMHGPVEMLDKNSVVIIFCPKICNEMDRKLISKIKNKKAKIIVVSNCICEEADELIKIENSQYIELISIVVIQKLAVEIAKVKGIDLDLFQADKVVR